MVAECPSTSMESGNRPATAAEMPAATASPATRSAAARPGERGQLGAGEVAVDADPPVGRQRVGAGVGDPAGAVEADQAVADARAHLGVLRLLRRERPGRDHEAEVGGDVEVGQFQRRRRPGDRQVRVLGQDRHHDAVVPDRDDLAPPRGRPGPVGLALGDRAALPVGDDERLGDDAVHLRAHQVLRPAGRGGQRPHLGDAPPGAARQRHPQGEVGEGEVGQQLPVGDQPPGVVDLGGARRRTAGQALGEARHGACRGRPWCVEPAGRRIRLRRGPARRCVVPRRRSRPAGRTSPASPS